MRRIRTYITHYYDLTEKLFICDLEIELIRILEIFFPSVRICGCILTIIEHIKKTFFELNLLEYKSNDIFNKIIKMLLSFVFVRKDLFKMFFNDYKACRGEKKLWNLNDFYKYFRFTFVGSKEENKNSLFPISFRRHYNCIIFHETRPNSGIEFWHGAFNNKILRYTPEFRQIY